MAWGAPPPTAAIALGILLAGCLGAPVPDDTGAAVDQEVALSEALPSMAKLVFATSDEGATPLDPILGTPTTTTRPFDVPERTAELRLALDVRPTLADQARPEDDVVLRVLDPDGNVAVETPALAAPEKLAEVLGNVTAGGWTLEAEARGAWNVGLVVVAVPDGYTPGIQVSISTPGATEVEHKFYPNRLGATAGTPTRITLYDYDPHAGVENLQHNLVIDGLGVETEGRTTWGEVRTVDFTPAAGTYTYYCAYHEETLRGTLVVT